MTVATRSALAELARSGGLAMLPETLKHAPEDGKWILEPKWDGARAFAVVEGGEARIYGRRGTDFTAKFALHAEALEDLPDGTVLDAELVCLRIEDGVTVCDWGGVQSLISSSRTTEAMQRTIQMVVFDVLSYDGLDCRGLGLVDRRAFLEKLFEAHDLGEQIILTPQLESSQENYKALVAAGYEGAMVKRLDSKYAAGLRGRGWGRLKHTHTEDYVVVGWEPAEGGFVGMIGALRLAQYEGEALVEKCKVGTGWKVAERKRLSADPEALIGRCVEVKTYAGIAQRHPVFVRWRDDKAPEDCRAEGSE